MNTRFVEKNKRRERRRKRSKTMNYYDPSRKRLVIYRSLQHIYAQIVDDPNGTTLVSVSSIEPALENELKKAKSKKSLTIPENLSKEELQLLSQISKFLISTILCTPRRTQLRVVVLHSAYSCFEFIDLKSY